MFSTQTGDEGIDKISPGGTYVRKCGLRFMQQLMHGYSFLKGLCI